MRTKPHRRHVVAALAGAVFLPGAMPAQAQADRPLELGVLPNLSARILLAQYQGVREHLARQLQRPVQVSTAPNWTAFYRRTAELEYDLVVTAANMARVAQLDAGYRPLVSYAPRIKGLIAVAKTKPLAGVDALKGQRLALSNPQSLVTLRGMQWLAEQGLRRDADFVTVATPTDDSVGNLVVRGECAAAMCSGGEFRAIPEAVRNELVVLTTFAEVPSFIVAASPRLQAAQTANAHQAWLALNESAEGKAFFAATGFTAMTEIAPGLLEQLDVYTADTRRLFAAG